MSSQIGVADSPQVLPPPLVIEALSPVDLCVADPDGFVIDKQSSQIPMATYVEKDVDGDGDLDDVVTIPYPVDGDYQIMVVPEPNADPADTYDLCVTLGNVAVTLADDVPIGDIPTHGYEVQSTETGVWAAPVADANGPYTGAEGFLVSLDGTGSYDPDGTISEYEWKFGDGSTSVGSSAPTHAYGDNGVYTMTLMVTDDDGLTSNDTAEVIVDNVAPTVGNITAPLDPVPVNTPINTGGNFTDPGFLDTHTAVWDWGDGNTSSGTVNETNGSVSGNHTYASAGVYMVTLSVTDDDGGTGESIFRYVVVYDPSAGFVTGGGWIDSLAGAYAPDTSLTGEATFGFVSRYSKRASVPTGQTEFKFHVANMNFKSTSYQWLVIARARAMYKGTGTINGEGNYGFMLSAIDEKLTPSTDVDLFRIRIWDKDNDDTIVYDNQMGDYKYADPTTAISGGSIVIHAK